MNATTTAAAGASEGPPRSRTYRKRRRIERVPRPVYPMRALWDAVSDEDRARAQQTCGTILEYWLGVTPKSEVARKLGVTPLRVWQMSQRAVTGMVCGLLRQPRTRRRPMSLEDPQQDPRALRRRIVRLEREIAWRDSLIQVLKDLPANRGRTLPARPKELDTEDSPAPLTPQGPREAQPRGTGTKGRRTTPRPSAASSGGSVAAQPPA